MNLSRAIFTFLVSILLLTGRVCLAAEREFQKYPLRVSDPSGIIEMVATLVGEDSKVLYDKTGHQLLVLATKKEHAQIKSLLKQVNITPRNVRLDVSFESLGRSVRSGGGVRVSGGVVITEKGTNGKIRLNPHARHQSTRRSGNVLQSLVVEDGGSASLRVGEEVPYIEQLLEWGHRWGYVRQQNIVMRNVGSALRFEPRIIGDGSLIRVRLTPELNGRVDGRIEHIAFTKVATEVTVRPGQPLNIGGFGEHKDFYSKFLVGIDKGGETKNLNITVTANIIDPAAPMTPVVISPWQRP